LADCGSGTMSRDDGYRIGQSKKMLVDGGEELAGVASGEVGAADGAGEEGVPGEEEGLLGEIEADTAFSVTGSVEDGSGEAGDGDGLAVVEGVVRGKDFRGGDAEPASLDVHHVDQGEIELVVEDGCASEFFEALGSGDVVDVSMGDDDLLEGELMLLEQLDDAGDVVAGIDDNGFTGAFVAKDGTVAPERAYDEDFVDHAF